MLAGVNGFTRHSGNEIARVRQPNSDGQPDSDGLIDTPVLDAVWFAVPPGCLADLDAWYDQDHVPILMQQMNWIAVRRFDIVDGEPEPFNRLARHYLADAAALDAKQRRPARKTPWPQRLAAETWFNGRNSLFKRHGTRQKAVK
jgi:hypothetical protein